MRPLPGSISNMGTALERMRKGHTAAAIVAAGPAANLLLAVLLYALVNWVGLEEPRAVLAAPVAESVAAQAGLRPRTKTEA